VVAAQNDQICGFDLVMWYIGDKGNGNNFSSNILGKLKIHKTFCVWSLHLE
jgi:hypothetical protein